MTIAGARAKGKALGRALLGRVRGLLGGVPRDAWVLAILIAASSASFGLGYLTGQEGYAASPGAGGAGEAGTVSAAGPGETKGISPGEGSGAFVASKNGTKYYLATCSGAKRITDANKVWFATAAAASAAGYAPAANCPGL